MFKIIRVHGSGKEEMLKKNYVSLNMARMALRKKVEWNPSFTGHVVEMVITESNGFQAKKV